VKNIWSKYKFPIVIIVYIFLLIIFIYYIVRPLVGNIRLRAYQSQAKSIDREIEQAQIDKLPEVKKEWSDYESRRNLLNVILSQPDQVSFIESIESIAQASGNKIDLKIEDRKDNISYGSNSKDILKNLAYPDYFPIQISLEGDYSGLVKFVHLLENSRFYVNVIAISSVKNSPDSQGNKNPFGSITPNNASDVQNSEDDSIKTEITAIVYTQKQ
jgi:hypothetical protein